MTAPHTVRIANLATEITVAADTTILKAAQLAGYAYPYGCQVGRCGACKSRLLSGEVELLPHTPFALTAADTERGFVLACRAQPRSDCSIAWLGSDTAGHPLREVSGRVVSLQRPTPDISILRVELEGAPLAFTAGQYAELHFAGCAPRNYSMANDPDEPLLEFHIRHVANGATSGHVASRLRSGDPVRLRGPMGTAHLRARRTGPILAVAGGTGLAPILSILHSAARLHLKQPIRLYNAARAERDLYQEATIADLANRLADFAYIPVLSGGPPLSTRLEALAELEGVTAYVAGSPRLVDDAVAAMTRRGLDPAHAYADAFFTTSDQASADGPEIEVQA